MLKIKLSSTGRKHQRTYKITVSEGRSKVNGRFVDTVGHYNPFTKEKVIDTQKLNDWVKKGAQLTLGVDKLLNPEKYPNKKKVKKVAETTA